MDLCKLVGKTLKITDKQKSGNGAYIRTKLKWLVTASYPHHVLCVRTCENGAEIRESFNEGTLIEHGIFKMRDVSDYEYKKPRF